MDDASTPGSGGESAAGGAGGGSGGSGGASSGGTGGADGGDCGLIETFESNAVPTRIVHVATSGDDTDGDGSEQNPFHTIGRALNGATPGTAVRIHSGVYAGGTYAAGLTGTEGAPIWIGGAPGEARPVIDGGGQALHLVRARYVVVHDLEVRNQTSNGINADDGNQRDDRDAARHIVFRNLHIHDVGTGGNQDCLKLSGIDDYYVLDSTFARCGGGSFGSAIDHVGCHGGLIARNHFTDLSGGNAVQCKGGSEDIEVRWNRIIDGGQRGVNMGGSTGFEFFRPSLSSTSPNAEARNIRVIANVIRGGIASLAFVGCVDCLAANNTIVDPDNWILRILQETNTTPEYEFLQAQDGTFVNNIIYFSRAEISTYLNVGGNTLPDTFTFRNNLWYAHDNPGASTPNVATGPESLYGQDPLFADAAAFDYAIGPSSPAASSGMPLAALRGDIDGRCWASPPSIGAYEVR